MWDDGLSFFITLTVDLLLKAVGDFNEVIIEKVDIIISRYYYNFWKNKRFRWF